MTVTFGPDQASRSKEYIGFASTGPILPKNAFDEYMNAVEKFKPMLDVGSDPLDINGCTVSAHVDLMFIGKVLVASIAIAIDRFSSVFTAPGATASSAIVKRIVLQMLDELMHDHMVIGCDKVYTVRGLGLSGERPVSVHKPACDGPDPDTVNTLSATLGQSYTAPSPPAQQQPVGRWLPASDRER